MFQIAVGSYQGFFQACQKVEALVGVLMAALFLMCSVHKRVNLRMVPKIIKLVTLCTVPPLMQMGVWHCSLYPVINDSFADTEKDVVALAPFCQETHVLL